MNDAVEGARTFATSGTAYDGFMGRYSVLLADRFADAADVTAGHVALDVGCGPGALTGVLVERLGADAVHACDPSPSFLEACAERHPGVHIAPGRAESLPFESGSFDRAMAQLVLHFVSDADAAAREMARVVRPGGLIAACVWDFDEGMEMLRLFWDAALSVDPNAPDQALTMRFGRPGEIADLFTAVGLDDVQESTLRVSSGYDSVDELWSGFMAGIGPAGSYCVGLDEDMRTRVRSDLAERLGSPTRPFTLEAMARCATARI